MSAATLSPMTVATSPLDTRLMLAMGVQSQPGVYALLLGSGVSTGAGIKTGWGIMEDLVRRAAVAAGTEPDEAVGLDAEAWWSEHRPGEEMNYSTLLEVVGGSTPSSRHGVLAEYFTATPEDLEAGRKVPSPAHRAIAELVAGGYVRVVLTTNFDNLLERALGEIGITPQVISRPDQVAAMQPLAHASATIIKLHGDVSEMTKLNTPAELSTYDRAWDDLLDRISHEYGLLISGWSGDTDVALRDALTRNPLRRFPLYWDARSSKSAAAAAILAMHAGQVVPAADADELFTALARSVASLAKMSEPPLSTALAVAALKRAIGDPTRHVEVEDLIHGAVRDCVQEVVQRAEDGDEPYGDRLRANLESARRPVSLLVAGTYYDRDRRYTDLWVEAVRDLMRAWARTILHSLDARDFARLYPAALAVRAAGVLALHRERPDVVLDLLRRPRASHPSNEANNQPAARWLHDSYVLDGDLLRSEVPGLRGSILPVSQHLRAVTYDLVAEYFIDRREYDLASDDYEFLVALIQWRSPDLMRPLGVASGVFMGDTSWSSGGELIAAGRFRRRVEAARDDPNWPLWNLLEGPGNADRYIDDFETKLRARFREIIF